MASITVECSDAQGDQLKALAAAAGTTAAGWVRAAIDAATASAEVADAIAGHALPDLRGGARRGSGRRSVATVLTAEFLRGEVAAGKDAHTIAAEQKFAPATVLRCLAEAGIQPPLPRQDIEDFGAFVRIFGLEKGTSRWASRHGDAAANALRAEYQSRRRRRRR